MSRVTRWAGVAFALLCTVPSVALGADEVEPNDGIHQPNVPLAGSTQYNATLATSGDEDWYAFYTSGPGPVTISLTNINDASNGQTDLDLLDDTGGYLNGIYANENATETMQFDAPGAGKYFLVAYDSNPGDRYRFTVSGVIGTGPGNQATTSVPNNNRDLVSAFGPLAGEVLYSGRLDLSGEEDWFYLYTSGPGTIDIALTNVDDPANSHTDLDLMDTNGEFLARIGVPEERIEHLTFTAPGAARYVLVFWDGSPGDEYLFRIDPASLITATPPPPAVPPAPAEPSKKCLKATEKLDKAKEKVKKAKEKLAQADTRAEKRKAKRKLNKAKAKKRKAKEKVAAAC